MKSETTIGRDNREVTLPHPEGLGLKVQQHKRQLKENFKCNWKPNSSDFFKETKDEYCNTQICLKQKTIKLFVWYGLIGLDMALLLDASNPLG